MPFNQNQGGIGTYFLGLGLADVVLDSISKNGNAFSAPSGSGINDLGNGWYSVPLDTADTDTVGPLAFHFTAGTGTPVDPPADYVQAALVTVDNLINGGMTMSWASLNIVNNTTYNGEVTFGSAVNHNGIEYYNNAVVYGAVTYNGAVAYAGVVNYSDIVTYTGAIQYSGSIFYGGSSYTYYSQPQFGCFLRGSGANIPFRMNLVNGNPATGKSVTVIVSTDAGVTFGAASGSVVESTNGNGEYVFQANGADTNGAKCIYRFTADGCQQTNIAIDTVLWND